jgi:hypothetical protein
LKCTKDILSLIAFLLGSPDYAILHTEPYLSRRPVPSETASTGKKRLKKAAN